MNINFKIKEEFMIDSKETKIISGAIHYFRSMPSTWEDKLLKLKAIGANTVETYVPWNLHEKYEGEWNLDLNLNLPYFLELAEKHNLMVIVRFGPYICAEHDYGGFPWWLNTKPGLVLRCDNQQYLEQVKKYISKITQTIAPYTNSNGGNVILGQLENEYGSYGNDKVYLKKLQTMIKEAGFLEPLVTSDGTWNSMLECGNLADAGVLPTVNFGSNADEHFDYLEKFNGIKRPLMCMEFWCGWFSAWNNKEIIRTDPNQVANELDNILKRGSVNFYMFHGGTNFGPYGGANQDDENGYTPDTTSYDYDALLDERGNVTPKYLACQKVISKYVEIPEIDIKTNPIRTYENAVYQGSANIFGNHAFESVSYQTPLSMEQLGYGYGYVLYETKLNTDLDLRSLELQGMADRALIFIDEKKVGELFKKELINFESAIKVCKGSKLSILVENTGRVNYGKYLDKQIKGITKGIFINNHFYHFGWTMSKVSLDYQQYQNLEYDCTQSTKPQVHKYQLTIDDNQICDTYIDSTDFGKGYIFVNGFNIGRFWNVGPQYKIFVPSELLSHGTNEILIIETEGICGDLKFIV